MTSEEFKNKQMFDIETGYFSSENDWGYIIWNNDYSVYDKRTSGYDSDDSAYQAACKVLDKAYGKNGWLC